MEQWRCLYCECMNDGTDAYCKICRNPRSSPKRPAINPDSGSHAQSGSATSQSPKATATPVWSQSTAYDPFRKNNADYMHNSLGDPISNRIEPRKRWKRGGWGIACLVIVALYLIFSPYFSLEPSADQESADDSYSPTSQGTEDLMSGDDSAASAQPTEDQREQDNLDNESTMQLAFTAVPDTTPAYTLPLVVSTPVPDLTTVMADYPFPDYTVPDFPANKRFKVYSGPGSSYYRGVNGKAVVSTNDWIRVYGVEDGWAMVEYSIADNHWRQGYIKESYLPNGHYQELSWAKIDGILLWACDLTDDPNESQQALYSLPGDIRVSILAQYHGLVLVDCNYNGQKVRGYIPADAIEIVW